MLREAARPEDLTSYLDGGTLIALWPDLHLPKGVRQAWAAAHPGLPEPPAALDARALALLERETQPVRRETQGAADAGFARSLLEKFCSARILSSALRSITE